MTGTKNDQDAIFSQLPTDRWIHLPNKKTDGIASTVRSLNEYIGVSTTEMARIMLATAVLSTARGGALTWSDQTSVWDYFLGKGGCRIDKFKKHKYLYTPGKDSEGPDHAVADVDDYDLSDREEAQGATRSRSPSSQQSSRTTIET